MNLKYRLIHNIGLPVSVLGKKKIFYWVLLLIDIHQLHSSNVHVHACVYNIFLVGNFNKFHENVTSKGA